MQPQQRMLLFKIKEVSCRPNSFQVSPNTPIYMNKQLTNIGEPFVLCILFKIWRFKKESSTSKPICQS